MTEARRLKSVAIFIQSTLSFVLSRKIPRLFYSFSFWKFFFKITFLKTFVYFSYSIFEPVSLDLFFSRYLSFFPVAEFY